MRAGAHGLAQGGIAELSGGDFLSGFASGAIGSLAGSGWSSSKWGFASSELGIVAFSAVSGGVGAELSGGSFWRGAVTAATITGLNHLAHNVLDQPKPKSHKQYKQLSKGEVNDLKRRGIWDHSDKGNGGGKIDLYKDGEGNVYEMGKGGKGVGEPLGINLRHLDEMSVYKNGWWNIKYQYKLGLTLPVISPAPIIITPVMPTIAPMPVVAPRVVFPEFIFW